MTDGPQSSLGQALHAIFGANADAIDALGSAISATADVLGLIPAIDAIIKLFDGSDQDPLQTVLTTVQNEFQKLNAELKAQDLLSRWKGIDQWFVPAERALGNLQRIIDKVPPFDDPSAKLDAINDCENGLGGLGNWGLSEADQWYVPYGDQLYWTDRGLYLWPPSAILNGGSDNEIDLSPFDWGYGLQAPTANGENLVFSYAYILPAYLKVLFDFLAVAQSLDQRAGKNYADQWRGAATLLQAKHDQIKSSITQLKPGGFDYWDGQTLMQEMGNMAAILSGNAASVDPGFTPLDANSTPVAQQTGYAGLNIEYGAVEKFSGYSSAGNYQLSHQEIVSIVGSSAFYKFQLRSLKRAKDVYIGVGLLAVWRVIRYLQVLVGDPPLARPNFGDWSFREIISIAQTKSRQDGSFSMLTVAQFIETTAPLDGSGPLSFRGLLS
jgi:hypothetical protein